jgi:hypothetical protein
MFLAHEKRIWVYKVLQAFWNFEKYALRVRPKESVAYLSITQKNKGEHLAN